MVAVAHTLVYDSVISEATTGRLLAAVTSRPSCWTATAAATTSPAWPPPSPGAAHALAPEPGRAWHGVPDDVLAPALSEFFTR